MHLVASVHPFICVHSPEAEASFQMPGSRLHEAKAEAGFGFLPMSDTSPPCNMDRWAQKLQKKLGRF